RAVRKRLPDSIELMVDYNQALSRGEAVARGRALDGEGIFWLEEPIRHDDWRGRAGGGRAGETPVPIRRKLSLPHQMEEALALGACDLVMPDVERIGGVTGWMRATAIAQQHRMEMSSHLAPEVSAHLLAVTPTCGWLEYVDWADPILAEPLRIERGLAIPPARMRSEEHTSELQSLTNLVCRLLLEKKKKKKTNAPRVATVNAHRTIDMQDRID